MSRLIDADALKENLMNNYVFVGFRELVKDFFEAIDEQPTVNQWISCSERLPDTKVEGEIEIMGNGQQEIVDSTFETSDPVLVTIKTNDRYKIAVAQWEVDGPKRKYWIFDDGSFAEDVVAWCELPEPYQEADK